MEPDRTAWWRGAVVYQIYLRSFADGDGDGRGDIGGLRARLDHLTGLGVDGIWINPWYPSPLRDGGYDVADYRDIHPDAGTLADADALIDEAHAAGLRVLLDLVPNHTSDQHAWFREALASPPGSPERDRYLFRDGRGPGGDEPPNNWDSHFGGPAWTRVTEADGRPGQWYLHLFAAEQPDVNWANDDVREDFDRTLRFWFDRGVDGFRIDVAHALTKDVDLRDLAEHEQQHRPGDDGDHPFLDRPEVHEVYRRWRAIADGYDPPRVFVAEAWVTTPARHAEYVRPDELHSAFAFDLLDSRWEASALRAAITRTLDAHETVGAAATWVLANHDVARIASRLARDPSLLAGHSLDDLVGLPADPELGVRRARAAALLLLGLPGTAYLYQGDELGLPEVEDLPDDRLTDPIWERTGGNVRGRDGCRVPLPWSGEAPPFGFGPPGAAEPWLPQPRDWVDRTVAAQDADPDSMLALYRTALRLRRDEEALGAGALRWVDAGPHALAFDRPPDVRCLVNLGTEPLPLPEGAAVLLASDPLDGDGALAPDTAAWLRLPPAPAGAVGPDSR